jgi:hypothetical protein
MLGWFNTKEVDVFVDSLVAELVERVPPASAGQLAGKKAFERLTRDFGATFRRIDAFARAQPLNLYKKAHFANRVRWGLREAGYPPEFVATMTQELLVHLTGPARKGGKDR